MRVFITFSFFHSFSGIFIFLQKILITQNERAIEKVDRKERINQFIFSFFVFWMKMFLSRLARNFECWKHYRYFFPLYPCAKFSAEWLVGSFGTVLALSTSVEFQRPKLTVFPSNEDRNGCDFSAPTPTKPRAHQMQPQVNGQFSTILALKSSIFHSADHCVPAQSLFHSHKLVIAWGTISVITVNYEIDWIIDCALHLDHIILIFDNDTKRLEQNKFK